MSIAPRFGAACWGAVAFSKTTMLDAVCDVIVMHATLRLSHQPCIRLSTDQYERLVLHWAGLSY